MTTISDMNPPSEPPLHSPIIACIDFSEDSRAALIWACRMADNSGGTLILLHIVHDLASHPGFTIRRNQTTWSPCRMSPNP
jgi:hypothetical protein